MKKVRRSRQGPFIIVLGDILLIPLSYIAAFYIRFGDLREFKGKIPLLFLFLMVLIYIIVFYFFDHYEPRKKYFSWMSLFEISFSVFVAGVLTSFLKYTFFLFPIGRGIFVIASLILAVSSFLWRTACYQLFHFFIKPKMAVIVGTGKPACDLAVLISSTASDFELAGLIEDQAARTCGNETARPEKVLGTSDELLEILGKNKIGLIILSSPVENDASLIKQLIEARLRGIEVTDLPEMVQFLKGKIPIDHVPEAWFLESRKLGLSEKHVLAKIKRLTDIAFSSFFLALSLPLWPLIALAIKINSRGPVIYKQKRIGKNETVFSLYKFRSMVDKAEKDGAVWADENDTRITVVGKILRNLHLDELPQLVNVLKGEMSLVGPRPERPEFVQELKRSIPYYSFRHIMKPGLTGWAQINFPYASSMEESHEKLEYDLYYISRGNWLLDIRIILKTAKASVFGKEQKKSVKKNES